jgi:Holliday junction resolvasome RuvABC endonuclease subunit
MLISLKMTTLALDLGTTTGWAVVRTGGGFIMGGTISFKAKRFEGGGMRYLRFSRFLDEQYKSGVSEIVFEEVARHAGTAAAHAYGGFLATLTAWCEEHDIPYQGVPVGTIKKFWTGKGNANKEKMMAEAVSRGFSPADDNEADALALIHWWIAQNEGENDDDGTVSVSDSRQGLSS